jgi:hypothetical protein
LRHWADIAISSTCSGFKSLITLPRLYTIIYLIYAPSAMESHLAQGIPMQPEPYKRRVLSGDIDWVTQESVVQAMWHAEYPALSVGANFCPDTAGHMTLKPMRTTASPGGNQSEPLFTRAF